MNLKEILAQVAERTSLTQKQTREVYDALVDVTTEALQKDDVENPRFLSSPLQHKHFLLLNTESHRDFPVHSSKNNYQHVRAREYLVF